MQSPESTCWTHEKTDRQHVESLLGMGLNHLSWRILTSVNVVIKVINLFLNVTTNSETFQCLLPESLNIPILVHAGYFPGLVPHLDIPEFSSWPVLTIPVSLLLDELFGLRIFHLTPFF